MNYKVQDKWQQGTEKDLYDYRQVYGIKNMMNGYKEARAIYGQFEVEGSIVIHSVYNGNGDEDTSSEFIDDMISLREGNVDFTQ